MKLAKFATLILIGCLLGYRTVTAVPNLAICNLQTINQAIPPRIFAEQTIDGPTQAVLLTRFLHNKVGIFLNEMTRCYFNLLDPNFIVQITGILGLVLILVAIYRLIKIKQFLLLTFFIYPLLSIFTNSGFLTLTKFILWTFAVAGAIILMKINEKT